jgi:hypothetical protein
MGISHIIPHQLWNSCRSFPVFPIQFVQRTPPQKNVFFRLNNDLAMARDYLSLIVYVCPSPIEKLSQIGTTVAGCSFSSRWFLFRGNGRHFRYGRQLLDACSLRFTIHPSRPSVGSTSQRERFTRKKPRFLEGIIGNHVWISRCNYYFTHQVPWLKNRDVYITYPHLAPCRRRPRRRSADCF